MILDQTGHPRPQRNNDSSEKMVQQILDEEIRNKELLIQKEYEEALSRAM